MIDPKKCIEWNESFGNTRWMWIDPYLETDMLQEELNELTEAMCSNDPVETIDGAIDLLFVVQWTLHKLGLTSDQITKAYDIVCESNMSKLWAKKNLEWKVTKGNNFIAPDFSEIIETL